MTVKELIEWLQQQPADAEVVLRDPDTEWLLPLKVGDVPGVPMSDSKPGEVVVHAEY